VRLILLPRLSLNSEITYLLQPLIKLDFKVRKRRRVVRHNDRPSLLFCGELFPTNRFFCFGDFLSASEANNRIL